MTFTPSALHSLIFCRPERLIFEDDPSFLPEFALSPPELLSELDHNFNLDIMRSGDSQSLTPFSSQRLLSSHADAFGGLILPTSSPVAAGSFRLEGDDVADSVGAPSGMSGAGDIAEIEDPDFMFGDNGEVIQFSAQRSVARTPIRIPGGTMSGDVKASVRVRKEHEEGLQAGNQVSSTAFSHVFLHRNIRHWSCGLASLPLLELRDMARHSLTAVTQAHSDV
jgi:hypothetical protein